MSDAISIVRRHLNAKKGPRTLQPADRAARAPRALSYHARIDHLSGQIEQVQLKLLGEIAALQNELRLVLGQMTLPAPEHWTGPPPAAPLAAGDRVFTTSALCRQQAFELPCYRYWTERLGLPAWYHRKYWEYVYVCQALSERGALRPGARGLGFGVGREPLAALFASLGCRVTGTDLPPEDSAVLGWSATAQHAAGLETLRMPAICPDATFDGNVEFRSCDMNAIPDDLTGYDFCWSACAFEHLGSIEHGLRFVERTLDCLKPGGWAIHTTEYNVSSNGHTVAEGGTVLFRRQDMEALAARLVAKGHAVAPLDFDPGDKPLDRYIDLPPYRAEPHLKLALSGFVTTSFGMIIQRAV